MKRFISALLCASVVLFASCEKEPDRADVNNDPVTLSFNPGSVDVDATTQTVDVALESNSGAFRVSSSESWVKPDITDKTMTLVIEANPDETARQAEITVTAGLYKTATAVLLVSQAANAGGTEPDPNPNPDPDPDPEPTPGLPELGAEYEGGIVVEITEEYVKIISKPVVEGESLDKELPWSPEELIVSDKPVGCVDKDNGEANMVTIKQYENWAAVCPVAKWCQDMGEGWYWPAANEYKAICNNPELFAKTGMVADKYYWSSTEHTDAAKAHAVKFKTETQASNDGQYSKKTPRYVRAMKKISIQK